MKPMKAINESKASLSLLWGTLGICFLLITISGINPSALLFLMVFLGACLFAISYGFRNEPSTPVSPLPKQQLLNPVESKESSTPHAVLPSVSLTTDTGFTFREASSTAR